MLSPVGCIISGVIMDILGRKLFMKIVFLPFALSWLIIWFASSVEMLYLGIAIQGMGAGKFPPQISSVTVYSFGEERR